MAEMNEREDSEVEEAARELRVLQEEEGQLMLTRDFAQLRRILKGELKEAESILARVNVSSPLYEACKAEVEKVKAPPSPQYLVLQRSKHLHSRFARQKNCFPNSRSSRQRPVSPKE